MKLFKSIALGGTFDHFHLGHEHFLGAAGCLSEKILVGLTGDKYLLKYPKEVPEKIESFSIRSKAVEKCLIRAGVTEHQIREITYKEEDHTFAVDSDAVAIVISEEHKVQRAVELINEKRIVSDRSPLAVIVVSSVISPSGERISSTKIRSS